MKKPISVDFKWSLWTSDKELWKSAGMSWEVFEDMDLDETAVIETAPKKEIRFGRVSITNCEEGGFEADGTFVAEWDTPEEIIVGEWEDKGYGSDFFHLSDAEIDAISDEIYEMVAFDIFGLGAHIEFSIKADTIGELMEKIDDEEERLLILEQFNSDSLHAYLDDIFDAILADNVSHASCEQSELEMLTGERR